ncbi:glycosyltransferase family protein [Pseudoxanthomonas spadix BD-a59]|uniref:Glycosyltransferase family protein n=1 Tax=Pseudoxanthomonas spadix (strain BD-a59) TaxID=1045855 RepID=G7UT89_PSEUP|nr:alpha-glucan family phosphorylase [Pseudoxanthomonas spadix]AER57335.1 glycosyltransferase family protein [Pseudoxanthomonas spadix BD-a59]
MAHVPGSNFDDISLCLRELAGDLSIHWTGANDGIWRTLDQQLWRLTRNPTLVLNTISASALRVQCEVPEFRALVQAMMAGRQRALAAPSWLQGLPAAPALRSVAYFSMEYMLGESLPIYSGGLGNVAGDQLKAASELGVPVTAVGILWQQGYFRQEIDGEGRQHALYPVNDAHEMAVEPLLDANGNRVRLTMHLRGLDIWIRGWQARVGRTRLLLLDTNDPANPVPIRLTTGQLYGGDSEMRLRQELVLGIGGWRMLLAAGVEPDICHLNDGHAALAVLERARSYMQAHDVSFQVALAATRPGNLFTTHTPVAAGFDRFAPALIARYLGGYAEQELGLSLPALLALGRQHAEADAEPFNMAYLAVRCAGAVNAVSSLHGQTSRDIFQGLFPRWPTPEVPVGHVTNGVHLPMWMSWRMRAALSPGAQAEDCIGDGAVDVPNAVAQASDGRLWDLRNQARTRLIVFARAHQARSRAAHGDTPERIASAGQGLDPHRLTVGFARRFASYKRPNLLLSDPERLLRLLNHPKRPLQLLVAGKAHPADLEGQQMLQRWHAFTRQAQTQGRVVLLQDYEVRLARHLIQGVDLWLNTPRRPWEASGTSGMKVLANGGLNLSQRDGWWAEACEGEVGWSIGDGEEHDASHDAIDAEQLYTVLEEEVVPAFYQRDAEGLPQAWLRRMRHSMSELVPRFTAERAVRDYTERYYLPGASAYLARTRLDPGRAGRLAQVSEQLRQHWPQIRFGSVQVQPGASAHQVELSLETGAIAPEWLQVQMYADGIAGQPARVLALEAVPGGQAGAPTRYRGSIPGDRPVEHYTARVIPSDACGLAVPLELPLIAWQR